jgi:hypothetical protein
MLSATARTQFTAYGRADKRNALEIIFLTWDDPIAGNPLYSGFPLKHQDDKSVVVNLNIPKFAVELIRYGISHGWNPEENDRGVRFSDGLQVLTNLGFDVSVITPYREESAHPAME